MQMVKLEIAALRVAVFMVEACMIAYGWVS